MQLLLLYACEFTNKLFSSVSEKYIIGNACSCFFFYLNPLLVMNYLSDGAGSHCCCSASKWTCKKANLL